MPGASREEKAVWGRGFRIRGQWESLSGSDCGAAEGPNHSLDDGVAPFSPASQLVLENNVSHFSAEAAAEFGRAIHLEAQRGCLTSPLAPLPPPPTFD